MSRTQLSPEHIFDCPAVFAALFKLVLQQELLSTDTCSGCCCWPGFWFYQRRLPSSITLVDANTEAKYWLSNQLLKKPLISNFNCSRTITSKIVRLRTNHFKDMKVQLDDTRSFVNCRNFPENQISYNISLTIQPLLLLFSNLLFSVARTS